MLRAAGGGHVRADEMRVMIHLETKTQGSGACILAFDVQQGACILASDEQQKKEYIRQT